MTISRTLGSLLVIAAGVAMSAVALAQSPAPAVVIRSSSATLKVGQLIDPSKPLRLSMGEQVTVIDDGGGIARLVGPFDGRPSTAFPTRAAADTKIAAALAGLLNERDALGVLRGELRGAPVGKMTALPDPWVVSVTHEGNACARGDRVMAWRSDASKDAVLVVEIGRGGKRARMRWAQGQEQLAIPANLFEDGAAYRLQVDTASVTITMRLLPPGAHSPVDQAVWMASVGCKVQALAMLDEIR